jgi:hypothetical protein
MTGHRIKRLAEGERFTLSFDLPTILADLRRYNGFRVIVMTRSGIRYPGVLYIEGEVARILQRDIPPSVELLNPDIVAYVELSDSLGWPVTNGSTEQTEAAAKLLRPFLGRRARLTYDDGHEHIGIVVISEQHGWSLQPRTVANRSEGIVIDIPRLQRVVDASIIL